MPRSALLVTLQISSTSETVIAVIRNPARHVAGLVGQPHPQTGNETVDRGH
jgi:hypothetical protein